jgi:hypothetical protein
MIICIKSIILCVQNSDISTVEPDETGH